MASYRSIESEPAVRNIDSFRGARDHASPVERLRDVRERARRFREEMLSGGQVVYYQSFDLVRVPYPTRYAFSNVYGTASVITPYIHILNRLFIVQFRSDDGIKTLLFSPSDVDGNRETPFFKRLSRGMGALTDVGEKVIAPKYNTVEECLEKVGLKPEHVDYISYDHLHTQALRKWLGTDGKSGYFPNAKLLVMRQEWESTLALLPPQMDWYCPDGLKGVDTEKVVLLDSDVRLGEGVALIQTPGHTEGDHSLVAHTPEGVFVTSENGVGPDAYAPENSEVEAIRKYARSTGMEVVLNGNTLERGLDQYISMVQERETAGASKRNPQFPNVMCSSEFSGYWLFPGVKPSFNVGEVEFGKPHFG